MDYLRGVLKKRLTSARYAHSLGVEEAAEKLALRYGVEPSRAKIAGLLHDYARDLPEEQLVDIARKKDLATHPLEYTIPVLLHAPVGASLVSTELKIDDAGIISAVAHHTIGARNMSLLDKIIFLADMIEPNRSYPGLAALREAAWQDLDRALLKALDMTVSYVITKGTVLHPTTVEARNSILHLLRRAEIIGLAGEGGSRKC